MRQRCKGRRAGKRTGGRALEGSSVWAVYEPPRSPAALAQMGDGHSPGAVGAGLRPPGVFLPSSCCAVGLFPTSPPGRTKSTGAPPNKARPLPSLLRPAPLRHPAAPLHPPHPPAAPSHLHACICVIQVHAAAGQPAQAVGAQRVALGLLHGRAHGAWVGGGLYGGTSEGRGDTHRFGLLRQFGVHGWAAAPAELLSGGVARPSTARPPGPLRRSCWGQNKCAAQRLPVQASTPGCPPKCNFWGMESSSPGCPLRTRQTGWWRNCSRARLQTCGRRGSTQGGRRGGALRAPASCCSTRPLSGTPVSPRVRGLPAGQRRPRASGWPAGPSAWAAPQGASCLSAWAAPQLSASAPPASPALPIHPQPRPLGPPLPLFAERPHQRCVATCSSLAMEPVCRARGRRAGGQMASQLSKAELGLDPARQAPCWGCRLLWAACCGPPAVGRLLWA